jgi:hypothetical protein
MPERLHLSLEGGFIMRHISLSIGIVAIACGLLAHATAARAVTVETWVSGTGSNAGACPITSPCRTFAFAFGQTSAGGTIHVLSSGNFGPLTITKAISIVAEGVDAMINTAAGGAAIIVQVGGTAIVSLRGLTIDERGTANDAISFVSGAALHVRNCTIRRAQVGIRFAPAGTSELYVADSVITDTSLDGLFIHPSGSGGAKVMVDRVRAENATGNGFEFSGSNTTGQITATVRDSVAAGNAANGIVAFDGDGSGATKVMIDHTAAVNNTNSGVVSVNAGATIRIGDSTVTGNGTGLNAAAGAVLESYGTNKVDGNGTDVSGATTIATR